MAGVNGMANDRKPPKMEICAPLFVYCRKNINRLLFLTYLFIHFIYCFIIMITPGLDGIV